MLKLRKIKKNFGNLTVLKSIDLDINEKEIVVLVGPSGGGKTTLLRIINMLERCDSGYIEVNGKILCNEGRYIDKKSMREIRKEVGMVFQSFNLLPNLTAVENIILSMDINHLNVKDKIIYYIKHLCQNRTFMQIRKIL